MDTGFSKRTSGLEWILGSQRGVQGRNEARLEAYPHPLLSAHYDTAKLLSAQNKNQEPRHGLKVLLALVGALY